MPAAALLKSETEKNAKPGSQLAAPPLSSDGSLLRLQPCCLLRWWQPGLPGSSKCQRADKNIPRQN